MSNSHTIRDDDEPEACPECGGELDGAYACDCEAEVG